MSLRAIHGKTLRRSALVAAALTATALMAGCSGGSGGEGSGDGLTMWVRHTDGEPVQKLVDLWNSGHDTKIKLTVVPGDSFQQKVGAAAGSNSLPDLLGADVVYSPNYVAQGIFRDITTLADGLPFKDDLSQAHQEATTKDGKVYGLPLLVDSSLMIYNKTLFEQAGLDPAAPPASFAEIYDDAKAIRDTVGGDTYGFYFAGNCPGCLSYTLMPFASAAGTPVLTDDGTTADIDSDAMQATVDLYKRLFDDGIVPSGAQADTGTSWAAGFNAGKIGMVPIGTFNYANLGDVDFEWDVAPFPAPDGSGTSTFVGGDVVGITRSAKNVEAAEEFLAWSLTDEPQLEVWAKNGFLTPRFDLANNPYTADNPPVVKAIEGLKNGYTPATLPYGEIFNSNNGPWLAGLRAGIFSGDPDALADAQTKIQKIIDDAQ